MNGTRASVAELIEALREQDLPAAVEVAVFPSCLHLVQVVGGLEGKAIAVGAQDCAAENGFGALTGEESAAQLADAGCGWVLVGHSERRLVLAAAEMPPFKRGVGAEEPVWAIGSGLTATPE